MLRPGWNRKMIFQGQMLGHRGIIRVGSIVSRHRGFVHQHCCTAVGVLLDIEFIEKLPQEGVPVAEFESLNRGLPQRLRSLGHRKSIYSFNRHGGSNRSRREFAEPGGNGFYDFLIGATCPRSRRR